MGPARFVPQIYALGVPSAVNVFECIKLQPKINAWFCDYLLIGAIAFYGRLLLHLKVFNCLLHVHRH